MVERLIQILNGIPSDKVAHFAGGAILAGAGAIVGPWTSLGLVMFAGVGKEIWDATSGRQFGHVGDAWDVVATTLGGVPVWVAMRFGGFL